MRHNGDEDRVDHFAEKLALFCICYPYLGDIANPGDPFPERVAAEVDAHNANLISGRDIKAVRILKVQYFSRQLAEEVMHCERLRDKLADIDISADLFILDEDRWHTLRGQVEAVLEATLRPGVRASIATKILYLKRPHLFPICDGVVMSRLMGSYLGDLPQAMKCIDVVRKIGTIEANANVIEQAQTHLSACLLPEHPYAKMSKVRALDAVLWFDSVERKRETRHFRLMDW
jgi:hypothetical protein